MRVLAVDPGLTRCGVAVVELRPDGRTRALLAEVVRTDPDQAHAARLQQVFDAVREHLHTSGAEVLVVERVFSQHNTMTVIGTAQAAGVTMLVAARHKLPVHQHTPSEVKAAITGSGRADKAQIGLMVTRVLKLAEAPKPADAADAVALAICHLWRGAGQARVAADLDQARRLQGRRGA